MRPDVWLTVYDADGSPWTIVIDDAPRIDAAVTRHIESGGIRDTLLDLTSVAGFSVRMRASVVQSWIVSTPETRARAIELAHEQDQEARRVREQLGIWEEP